MPEPIEVTRRQLASIQRAIARIERDLKCTQFPRAAEVELKSFRKLEAQLLDELERLEHEVNRV